MTDADRQRLAAAAASPEHRQLMTAQPNTWIKLATGIAVLFALMCAATLAYYPPWRDVPHMPGWWKPVQLMSFLPMLGGVGFIGVLFVQSLGLHMMATTRHTALVTGVDSTPDGQWLELTLADGQVLRQRCRRRAASQVRVGLVAVGEVGVALGKGAMVLEWHPIALR